MDAAIVTRKVSKVLLPETFSLEIAEEVVFFVPKIEVRLKVESASE